MASALLLLFFGSWLASLLWTRVAIGLAYRTRTVDRPGHRKTHARPVAYLGGLGLMAGILSALTGGIFFHFSGLGPDDNLTVLLACLVPALIMAVLGLVDDIREISVAVKLTVQLGVASFFCYFFFRFEVLQLPGFHPMDLTYLGLPISILYLLAITNSFNMIDGSDGLCAAVSLVVFLFEAIVAADCGQPHLICLCVAAAGACAGFLAWNRPAARVYLGDAGSQGLGMLAACIMVALGSRPLGFNSAALNPAQPFQYQMPLALLLVGYPVLEISLTIARRGLQGRSLWRGDQGHLHHRLAHLGIGAWGILAVAVCLTVLSGAVGLAIFEHLKGLAAVLLLLLAGCGGLMLQVLGFTHFFHRNWLEERRPHFSLARHYSSSQMIKLRLAQSRREILHLVAQFSNELGVEACQISFGQKIQSWAWKRRRGGGKPAAMRARRLVQSSAGKVSIRAEWKFAEDDPSLDHELAMELKVIMAELMKKALFQLQTMDSTLGTAGGHFDSAEKLRVHVLSRRVQRVGRKRAS
jgi:UDP-GlcNAc:undecaprenyl-phosphate GlcNAc-1-phosphate transferase